VTDETVPVRSFALALPERLLQWHIKEGGLPENAGGKSGITRSGEMDIIPPSKLFESHELISGIVTTGDTPHHVKNSCVWNP